MCAFIFHDHVMIMFHFHYYEHETWSYYSEHVHKNYLLAFHGQTCFEHDRPCLTMKTWSVPKQGTVMSPLLAAHLIIAAP